MCGVRDEKTKEILPVEGGRWAISRYINGRLVALIEKTPARHWEVVLVLETLHLQREADTYFPKNKYGQRCPTFELMRLFDSHLQIKKARGYEEG